MEIPSYNLRLEKERLLDTGGHLELETEEDRIEREPEPETEEGEVERELEEEAVERMNERLHDIDPRNVNLYDASGSHIAGLMRANVYDYIEVDGRTRFVIPERRQDISGIRFQFTEDTYGRFGKDEHLRINSIVPDYFEGYRSLLQKIQGVKDRALPEDKKMKLLETLENRRGALHNRAATAIQQCFISRPYESVLIDHEEARKAFEVLYEIWDAPQHLDELTYSEGALDDVDLEEVKDRVFQETGAEIGIRFFTYGYHENAPTNQYKIEFPKPVHPEVLPQVKRIIESYIKKRKSFGRGR